MGSGVRDSYSPGATSEAPPTLRAMSFEALMLLFAAIEAAAASLVIIRAVLEKNT